MALRRKRARWAGEVSAGDVARALLAPNERGEDAQRGNSSAHYERSLKSRGERCLELGGLSWGQRLLVSRQGCSGCRPDEARESRAGEGDADALPDDPAGSEPPRGDTPLVLGAAVMIARALGTKNRPWPRPATSKRQIGSQSELAGLSGPNSSSPRQALISN
jgi:hypothetical protein